MSAAPGRSWWRTAAAPAVTYSSWGLTVLRVVVGAIFLLHGAHNLFETGIGAVAGTFHSLQIPLPLLSAVVVTLLEFLGGIALLLGGFTRAAGAVLAMDMFVATLLVYLEPGSFKKGGGIELPLTLLAASIALALSGRGAASLDGLRKHVTPDSSATGPSGR